MGFARYALYYLPPVEADWTRFCTGWLGWDADAGRVPEPPSVDGLPRPLNEITQAPRRYGLHATIKPPFRLTEGACRADLEAACADMCNLLHPVRLEGLRLARLGRFLTLRPVGDEAALNAMAAECVLGLDRFRAPMPTDERDRRARGLSEALAGNLVRWGYPFVMQAFRFHITLTGRLPEADLADIENTLARTLVPLLPAPFVIGDLALAGEDASGRFHRLRRFPLNGPGTA